jgi:hypothetical protein
LTKPKTRADLVHSLELDWPPRQPTTIADLIAEARAVAWDFTHWCYVSGYDASDPMLVTCLSACWLTQGARAVPG